MNPAPTMEGRFVRRLPFGADLQTDGSVRFRVWAPEAATVRLALEHVPEPLEMAPVLEGWHELTTRAASAGSRYTFVLPNGLHVPDPVSRYQPQDVNGPSEVMNPLAYAWQSTAWKGRPWEETVLYELHVGAFTPQGTFRAAIGKLDYLADLGVTAIEIMSIGDFPGARNWGYDSVLLYAPDSSYGPPDDLKAFVDEAHRRRIAVILDVVYNHFGPEGNYLPQYFPDICTDRYSTPWGQALNFDSRHSARTRELIMENAFYWLEEFQMDGLRLDAVHAIMDASSVHILDELARRVRSFAGDRHIHLILESDDTMRGRLIRDEFATPLLSTAQWNHDSKELAALGLSASETVEEDRRRTGLLGRALVDGFTSQPPLIPVATTGNPAVEAGFAAAPGEPVHLSPLSFVCFLQTHDLVGNRIAGERISHIGRPVVIRALAAIYLLSPQIPMLFMGEEWSACSPFPYFCDFKGDLAEAVRRGRLEQFATPEQRQDPEFLKKVPDPLAEDTFLSAKLRWEEIDIPAHAASLDLYRELLQVRQRDIVPLLSRFPVKAGNCDVRGPRTLQVVWRTGGGELRVDANLSDNASAELSPLRGKVLWQQGTLASPGRLGPWSVRWSLYSAERGSS